MPASRKPGAGPGNRPKSVLIVDDQEATRLLLRTAVEGLPFPCVVREAANGDSALRLARAQQPDLVLLDIILPGSTASGVMLCNQFCRVGARVVIVSGQGSSAIVQACLSSGAIDYIPKPFSLDALREKLQDWLRE